MFDVPGFLMFIVGRLFVPRAPVASQASGLPRGSGGFFPPPYSRPLRPFGSEGFPVCQMATSPLLSFRMFQSLQDRRARSFRTHNRASFEGVAGGSKNWQDDRETTSRLYAKMAAVVL